MNKLMRPFRTIVIAIATVVALPGAARASHPGYLHALTDLRDARELLYAPNPGNVKWDQNVAIREIDDCIHDQIKAAINDGKNVHDHPIADVGLDFHGRLHKALDLLKKARHDMDKEEDDPLNTGLQLRATQHVDRAIAYVRKAIGDKEADGL